jgi:cytochrome c2
MHHRQAFAVLAIAACTVAPAFAQDQAIEEGERLYQRLCATCHSLEEGRNLVGPSLHDIVGREAGVIDGVRYSSAMQDADITWVPEEIKAFIEAPREYLPGTRMAFTGVRDEEDREAIVAYLASETEGWEGRENCTGKGDDAGAGDGGADASDGTDAHSGASDDAEDG